MCRCSLFCSLLIYLWYVYDFVSCLFSDRLRLLGSKYGALATNVRQFSFSYFFCCYSNTYTKLNNYLGWIVAKSVPSEYFFILSVHCHITFSMSSTCLFPLKKNVGATLKSSLQIGTTNLWYARVTVCFETSKTFSLIALNKFSLSGHPSNRSQATQRGSNFSNFLNKFLEISSSKNDFTSKATQCRCEWFEGAPR